MSQRCRRYTRRSAPPLILEGSSERLSVGPPAAEAEPATGAAEGDTRAELAELRAQMAELQKKLDKLGS